MSKTRDAGILEIFGRNLQKIRESKGISLRSLESLTDVDFSEIHRIEKGKRNPTLTILLALAKGLGVEPKDLLEF